MQGILEKVIWSAEHEFAISFFIEALFLSQIPNISDIVIKQWEYCRSPKIYNCRRNKKFDSEFVFRSTPPPSSIYTIFPTF